CLAGQSFHGFRSQIGPSGSRGWFDQLAEAPVLGDALSVLARRDGSREGLLIPAEPVSEYSACVRTDGQSDALAAGVRLSFGRLDQLRRIDLAALPRRE